MAVVRSAYAAFDDYDLWNAVFRIWAWGSGGGSFQDSEYDLTERLVGEISLRDHLLRQHRACLCARPGP